MTKNFKKREFHLKKSQVCNESDLLKQVVVKETESVKNSRVALAVEVIVKDAS